MKLGQFIVDRSNLAAQDAYEYLHLYSEQHRSLNKRYFTKELEHFDSAEIPYYDDFMRGEYTYEQVARAMNDMNLIKLQWYGVEGGSDYWDEQNQQWIQLPEGAFLISCEMQLDVYGDELVLYVERIPYQIPHNRNGNTKLLVPGSPVFFKFLYRHLLDF